MSTKISLSYGKNYHLYQEIFDSSHVYLQIDNVEFEVSNTSAMVQIPVKIWREMILDWSKRGWSDSDDGKNESVEEWTSSLEFLLKDIKNSKED
jgi:hypothetical protein